MGFLGSLLLMVVLLVLCVLFATFTAFGLPKSDKAYMEIIDDMEAKGTATAIPGYEYLVNYDIDEDRFFAVMLPFSWFFCRYHIHNVQGFIPIWYKSHTKIKEIYEGCGGVSSRRIT